ncbi:leucine-rich_repeat protein [Hexamita inflata]|uniref:Leucine-rich repeat protein n=1 Tax=Hexamita inflata TaxID=28002 RepID=A0AA86QAS0_9EUKA|nr:leucine-rich repeat protein [Hexamita inflata]
MQYNAEQQDQTNNQYLEFANIQLNDDQFEKIQNIAKLRIINCQGIVLSKFLPNKLQELTINYSKLQNIQDIQTLQNLIKLDLSNNNLQNVEQLNSFSNLKEINLNNNNITNLNWVKDLQNVNKLQLSNNRLLSARILTQLQNLNELDVSGNVIQDLIYLHEHPNFKPQWLSFQKLPTLQDYERYFECSNESNALLLMRQFSTYNSIMLFKYEKTIFKNQIEIFNDPELQSLSFVQLLPNIASMQVQEHKIQ